MDIVSTGIFNLHVTFFFVSDNEIRDLGVMSADSGAHHFVKFGIISVFITSVLFFI